MAYKINIRNTANTGWVNLLESQYHVVEDDGGYFSGATVETVLAELFTTKARRVEDVVAPTVSENLETGTVWVDTAANTVYVCVDATVGANIWLNLSSLDTEGIQDIAGGLITAGVKTNITATYNDAENRIDLSVATATDSVLGVASFDSAFFDVAAGAVSLTAGGVTVTELASNINATGIGFNADKVDGRDVDDVAATSTNTLWTSQKVKDYVDGFSVGLHWQEAVLDKDLNDPPASPTTGDRYIVSWPAAAATGAWLGHDNEIAEWNGTAWEFSVVEEGYATWVVDEDVVFVYTGTTWAKIGTTITHANLIGLQGGGGQFSGDLYHFTGAEHTALTGDKAANTVFAAPDGAAGVGGFRALVQADIPALAASKIITFSEEVEDVVGAMITLGSQTNITVTYQDNDSGAGALDFSIAAATTGNLGVASFDPAFFSVTAGHVTLTTSAVDHGNLSGLADDDHTQYVHNTIARSITAQHTFAPTASQAPFTLSANAQGQLVTGFNADLLNGQDWTVAATASAPATPQTNDIWIEITA